MAAASVAAMFGRKKSKRRRAGQGVIAREFPDDVVGESYRAGTIRKLMADVVPDSEGWQYRRVTLTLLREPTNPHDPNTVKVMVRSSHVGYIPGAETGWYLKRLGADGAKVPGIILGREGNFGVRLNSSALEPLG